MENKKTTELLDLLQNLKDEDYEADGKYRQIMDELKKREPFDMIFDEMMENSLPYLVEIVEDLQDEIKKLKRHKHEYKTGDVMIRI